LDDVLHGDVGEWLSMEAVDTDFLNPPEYINPGLLTMQQHEHQNYFVSGIDQSNLGDLTPNSQSQSLLDLYPPNVQQPPSTPKSAQESRSGRQERLLEVQQDFLASASPCLSPTQSASPASSGQTSSDAPDGKIEILPAQLNITCPTCKKSFSSSRQREKHIGALRCLPFPCHGCGKKFKNMKDFQRHRGHESATPSCIELKSGLNAAGLQVKPFACTYSQCQKAYTRKDSLIRHMQKHRRFAML
jgi:uncharacterized Zn-finger protein